jgi:ribosome-associated protein
MDMKKRTSWCDTFVVMSAPSSVRVKAIVDGIEEQLENEGLRVFHKEGYGDAIWVLVDCGEVIVHVFQNEMRRFYDLERLWGDAHVTNFIK